MAVNEKAAPIFKGAATALITPFRDGRIDYQALADLLDIQIKGQIDAVVVLGTTGEASTLTEEERTSVIRFSVSHVGGRIPVIAGTGANDTLRAVRYTERARDAGADACLVVTPYYNKATKLGLVSHYRQICRVGLPVIVYNVPSRTGMRLSSDDYAELAALQGVEGIKEASSDIAGAALTALRTGHTLSLYAGNDSETTAFLSLGAEGVISVLSNLFPREVHTLCQCFFDGDTEGARRIFYRYLPLTELLFREVNPTCVKYAASLLFNISPELRLPLTEPCADTKNRICRELARLASEA